MTAVSELWNAHCRMEMKDLLLSDDHAFEEHERQLDNLEMKILLSDPRCEEDIVIQLQVLWDLCGGYFTHPDDYPDYMDRERRGTMVRAMRAMVSRLTVHFGGPDLDQQYASPETQP